MLEYMSRGLKCEVCGDGVIQYLPEKTLEVWRQPEIFELEYVDKLKDGIISDVLVFMCTKCGVELRYTFKEIEKLYRREVSKRLLTLMAKGEMSNLYKIESNKKIFIYCGKCGGFDGKGICPEYIYNDCKLKRLPWDRII